VRAVWLNHAESPTWSNDDYRAKVKIAYRRLRELYRARYRGPGNGKAVTSVLTVGAHLTFEALTLLRTRPILECEPRAIASGRL
jgi:hypothetical protein